MDRRTAGPLLTVVVTTAAVEVLRAAVARPAAAHGIGRETASKSPIEFVPIGIEHMLLGWDHLLFIEAVVLLAGTPGAAAKLITVFVVGHSTTLIAATTADWRVDPRWVDVVIVLSIVYVGVVGLCGRPTEPRHRLLFGAGVLAFGLVHGLGLSTRLQDLGLAREGLVARVVAFNVGIEIGQLLAIGAIVLFGRLVIKALKEPSAVRRAAVGRYANLALALVGAVAAGFLADKAVEGVDPYEQMLAGTSGSCEVRKQKPPPVLGGGRTEKQFFAPTEPLPTDDFAYLVGDGFVAIRYSTGLPRGEWEQIEGSVDHTPDSVAGPVHGQAAAMVVVTQRRVLTCDAVDIEALAAFRVLWARDRGDAGRLAT